ncbi:Netrin receptor UNC5C-like protein [Daphnia magna]|uniref:Netrin receptor UNC5C-like protein n=1 Tax=Daphnia magna TaxID=35525 RepID=A0A162Q7L5_9CRUS|nr:Netrin receptor UNC5C-like protein [Daphnia magna]
MLSNPDSSTERKVKDISFPWHKKGKPLLFHSPSASLEIDATPFHSLLLFRHLIWAVIYFVNELKPTKAALDTDVALYIGLSVAVAIIVVFAVVGIVMLRILRRKNGGHSPMFPVGTSAFPFTNRILPPSDVESHPVDTRKWTVIVVNTLE